MVNNNSRIIGSHLWLVMSIERIHGAGRSVLIVDTLMGEDRPDGQGYDLKISGKRQMVNIPHVELELLRP